MKETVYIIYLLKTNNNHTVNVILNIYHIKYIYKYTKEYYNFIIFLINSKFYKSFKQHFTVLILTNTVLS